MTTSPFGVARSAVPPVPGVVSDTGARNVELGTDHAEHHDNARPPVQRALRFEVTYPHPPAKVWRVITTREHLARWLMENDFAPEVGRKFQFRAKPVGGWDGIVHAQVLELEPERRLVLAWKSNVIDTKVTFLLEPVAGGTRLTLLHTGFEGFKPVMTSFILGMGWKGHLNNAIPALITTLEKEGRL